jgi:hypothetical protein
MRRGGLVLLGLLLSLSAHAVGILSSYYVLELRGGSHLYASDKPVRKGRVLLFHRYPDGAYLSLAAGEVASVTALESAPPPVEGRLKPGETVYVGGALEGPRFEGAPSPPADMVVSQDSSMYSDYGYGYWGGGGYIPRPPGPSAPSNIGPNGYPIIAPPGTPGSVPNPIGPNGYPILAPAPAPPPVAMPRRQ